VGTFTVKPDWDGLVTNGAPVVVVLPVGVTVHWVGVVDMGTAKVTAAVVEEVICPRASPCVAGPFGSVDPDEDVALPAERFERPKRDVSGSNRFFASSATRWKRSSRTP
jgi:hypothetical protein